MKRFSIFLIAIVLGFTLLGFTGCKKGDTIRLNEVTHSIFYAPLYTAINKGYFNDEGLTIELTNGGGSDASMTALLSGSADIALMGPETNVYVISQGRTDYPVIFGQLTKRDGSFLVGRTAEPNFSWQNVAGKYFIGGRRGGSPAMSLEYALKNNGLTPGTNVTLDLTVAFNMTVGAFEGGLGDYVTMFEPTASEYVAAGKGFIVASVGQESGEVPFTCFSANKSYLAANPQKIEKFLKAIMRGYNFIMNGELDDVIDSLVPSFDGSSRTSIGYAVTSYKNIDAWMNTPIMQETAFTRLQDVMQGAGELTNRVDFADAVNNTFATKVMQDYFNI